ncbi:MAG: GNAT family N-acetyltransferase [Sediminispirochaetaceae bacterium]
MSENISIRTTIMPGDIGSIIKIHGEYYHRNYGFDSSFEPYVAIPLAEFVLRQDPDERIWIVEQDSAVKGSIAITKIDEDTAQLRWYFLDPALRGLGIGRELIVSALTFTKQREYRKIILWTVDQLDRALSLYIKNGFTLTEEKQHTLWGRELNEQCYEKSLR